GRGDGWPGCGGGVATGSAAGVVEPVREVRAAVGCAPGTGLRRRGGRVRRRVVGRRDLVGAGPPAAGRGLVVGDGPAGGPAVGASPAPGEGPGRSGVGPLAREPRV